MSRGTMEHSVALHFVTLILLLSDGGAARSLPFNVSSEGSGEMETEERAVLRVSTQSPTLISPTSSLLHVEPFFYSRMANFLQENLLLTIVLSSLVTAVIFLLCCASFMSQRCEASAYYPSSFPAQKYVDERDKIGGSRTFSEVPERQPDSQGAGPVDSTKKLQADIMNAVKNLRSPTRTLAAVDLGGKNPKTEPGEVKEQPERDMKEMVGEENHTLPEQPGVSRPQRDDSLADHPQESPQKAEGDEVVQEHTLGQETDQHESSSGPEASEAQQEAKMTQEKEVVLPSAQTIVVETAAF